MAPRSLPLLFLCTLSLACRSKDDTPLDSEPIGPEDTADTEVDEDLDNTYEICEDTTWSGEVVVGAVYYVCKTATLTIDPGATIAFKPGSGLVVDGVLKADGTAEAPITFKINYSISGSNYGVSIGGEGDQSSLSFASFTSIDLRLEGRAAAGVSDLSLADSTLGVYSRDAEFSVSRVSFADNQRDDQSGLIARDLPLLTVSDSTFDKVSVGILFDGVQDEAALNVSNVSFTDSRDALYVGSVGKYKHSVTATGMTISNSSSHALLFYNADVTLNETTITDTNGYAIYGDLASTVHLNGVDVNNTTGVSVYVIGSIEADGLSVRNSETSGVYGGKKGSTLRNTTVDNVQGYALYSTGDLTVIDSKVSNTTSTSIYAVRGDLTVTGSEVTDSLGTGIYATYGDVIVRDTLLERLDSHGVYSSTASITVSDITVREVLGSAVYAYRSSLTVEPGAVGVLIEDVDGSGLYSTDGDIVAENVTISNVRGTAVYARYGDLTLRNAQISEVIGTAVYGYFGDVVVSDVHVSDVYGTGIYSYRGDMTVTPGDTGVTVTNAETYGLYTYTGNMVAEGFTTTNTRNTGVLVSYGDLTVKDCEVTESGSHGIYGQEGDLSVTNCVVTDIGGAGVALSEGSLATVTEVSITNADTYGVYVKDADGVLSGVSVDNAGSQGIYITGGDGDITDVTVNTTGSSGVQVSVGDLTLSDATIGNVAGDAVYVSAGDALISELQIVDLSAAQDQSSAVGGGIDVRGHALVTNTLIDKTEGYGLYAQSAEVSYTTISNGLDRGVTIYGNDASSITYSDVIDNGSYGVVGVTKGANGLQISKSNITGNYEYGVYYAQLMDGCYVANNYRLTGADTTSGGSIDANFTTKGTQYNYLDSVTSPASSEVSGTGPTSGS
ncbi:right-handed parallel beta-helix repeat-containing protein [Myxococcota bacterium]|nr:right-handed parallel beta-helix repeat-containing protein [Myxococcota bacterium]